MGLPCPPVLVLACIAEMMNYTTPLDGAYARFLPDELVGRADEITTIGAAAYAAAGLGAQLVRARTRASLRARGLGAPHEPTDASTR